MFLSPLMRISRSRWSRQEVWAPPLTPPLPSPHIQFLAIPAFLCPRKPSISLHLQFRASISCLESAAPSYQIPPPTTPPSVFLPCSPSRGPGPPLHRPPSRDSSLLFRKSPDSLPCLLDLSPCLSSLPLNIPDTDLRSSSYITVVLAGEALPVECAPLPPPSL